MRKKGFLQLAFFAVALFLALPVVAQNESVVTLAGNAYITAGSGASIDEANCAIRDWNDKETVISFYKVKHNFNTKSRESSIIILIIIVVV